MDAVQSAAVAAANVAFPGSGAAVNSAFELAKICFQIGLILNGMGDSASTIKTQHENIKKDVNEFSYVLELVQGRLQNQNELSKGLQQTIVAFESDVSEYNRVMDKFKKKSLLKQLLFRSSMDVVSAKTKETTKAIKERLVLECSIDSRNQRRSVSEDAETREKRYMAQVDSPEVTKEMADPDNQKETLSIIKHIERVADDPVVSVLKDKLWSSSSAAVRNEINNLPDWHVTENQVEVDETHTLGFGGDAVIYTGVNASGLRVAVKILNIDVRRSERAKRKFIGTMNLWRTLIHENICRFYGVCYLTAAPFVVMELCEGGSLDKFLRRQPASDRSAIAIDLLIQAAHGIASMHSTGIVHGDLKCDNILVTEGSIPRQAKVCDFDRSFDWVAVKNRCVDDIAAEEAGIEISEAVQWLAPECVEGKLPSPTSDVYSFGMTLYQALMGRSPYYHIDDDEELRKSKLAHELPKRKAEIIGDDVWDLITRTSHSDPHQRPTMHKVMVLLESISRKRREPARGQTLAQPPLACPLNPVSSIRESEEREEDIGDSKAFAILSLHSDTEEMTVETPVVRAPFDLARICADIGRILDGMGKSSLSIKTQSESIQDDVGELSYVLSILMQPHENALSKELQYTVVEFKEAVTEYDRVINKFKSKSLLKQLVLHSEMDAVSAKAWVSKAKLIAKLVSEGVIAAVHSDSPSTTSEAEYRKLRYMAFVNSPEVAQEIGDVDSQREVLALIKHLGNPNGELVPSALNDKLWTSASAAIKNEIESLPSWYVPEDVIEIDNSSSIDCGGDVTISTGVRYPSATPVTVQTFSSSFKHAEQTKQKFIAMMNIWHKLKHPNVRQLYGACYLTATPFVVTEFCSKGPFDKFLRMNENSRHQLALAILLQAAEGVQSMHSIGIVHGDLKCDNIQVTTGKKKAYEARVSNFDHAFDWTGLKNRYVRAAQVGIEISDAILWVAPECVQGGVPSPASDVYSFGMTLYEALTGKFPYHHLATDEEIKQCKLAHELPTRESDLITDEAWELVTRTCHLDPKQRPPMQEVITLLNYLSSKSKKECTVIRKTVSGSSSDAHPSEGISPASPVSVQRERCNIGETTPPTATPSPCPQERGFTIDSRFDSIKICFQIKQVLTSMCDCKAPSKSGNVEADVEYFSHVLELLETRVQRHRQLSKDTQLTILLFESSVSEYALARFKFKKKNALKQVLFRKEVTDARVKANANAAKLEEDLNYLEAH